MLKSSYKPFVVTTGDVYEGGVIINSENTSHIRGTRANGEEYTEEEIYDNVWIKGTHGYEKVGYGTNSHWEELIGLSDRINKLKKNYWLKE